MSALFWVRIVRISSRRRVEPAAPDLRAVELGQRVERVRRARPRPVALEPLRPGDRGIRLGALALRLRLGPRLRLGGGGAPASVGSGRAHVAMMRQAAAEVDEPRDPLAAALERRGARRPSPPRRSAAARRPGRRRRRAARAPRSPPARRRRRPRCTATPAAAARRATPERRLAERRLGVDPALAGDHEVGPGELAVEVGRRP